MERRPPRDTANPPAPAADPPARPAPFTRRGTSRTGKRGVAFWLEPTAFRQLGQIALDEDRSVQSLMEEATDLLFTHRGRHRLANPTRDTNG